MAEVEHGRLAAENATHDEVKQFGLVPFALTFVLAPPMTRLERWIEL